MPRRPVPSGTLVREYITRTEWLPPEHPEWWALHHAASPDKRRALMEAPEPAAGQILIVIWRLPFGVRTIDVRYFREWRRQVAPRAGRVLLAVELEGPPGDTPKERDGRVQAQLDELSWVLERLWLASAETPFERPARDRRPARRDGAADVGSARSGADDQAANPPSASSGATGLILLRPDGASMLGTPLSPPERHALDIAVGSPWVTATDVQPTLEAPSGARRAEVTSRLLGHLRNAGAIHPAEVPIGDEAPPARASGSRGQVRLHRSALYEATFAMLASLRLREVPSQFSIRHVPRGRFQRIEWARRLRAQLRAAGLLTV